MGDLHQAVLLTIHYADIFDSPLLQSEVHRFLFYYKASEKQVGDALESLEAEGSLEKTGKYYHLPERSQVVSRRLRNESWVIQKKVRAQRLKPLLFLIPWVKFVGISGGVAAHNSRKDDDIDLFIIIASQRLWLARPLLVGLLFVIGSYRKVFCPNIWLEPVTLCFPQSAYTAHELSRLIPLINKEQHYELLLLENKWLLRYLPNTLCPRKDVCVTEKRVPFLSEALDVMNILLYQLQRTFMQRKITTERVEKRRALFLSSDSRPEAERCFGALEERIFKKTSQKKSLS